MDLDFGETPQSVSARTDAGDITVTVPEQTGPDGNSLDYAVDALSDAGRVEVDVVQDPRSRRSITAVSDAVTFGSATGSQAGDGRR